MKECFREKSFRAATMLIIERINIIVEKYENLNQRLTLRQMYYQFVGHDYFPKDRTFTEVGGKWKRDPRGTTNAEPNYDWLGELLNDARLAGLVDWEAIEDRHRSTSSPQFWKDPADMISQDADYFAIDRWDNQPNYVEVMVEKQALEGILEPICRTLRVPFTCNKGYTSSSTMRETAARLMDKQNEGKGVHVVYLGDHDPSGMDMSRDIQDRINLFTGSEDVQVHRIALNMDQVRRLRLIPNPAKVSDGRAPAYIRQFGDKSWELDAVEPTEIGRLVRREIVALTDEDLWQESGETEDRMKREIQDFADKYNEENE